MSSDEEGNSAKGIGLGDSVASERRSYAQARHEISRVRSDRASWYLLVGLLTFAPLAFGAVEYWSIAVLELLAVLLFVVWVIDGVRRDRISLRFNSLHWAALGFLLYVTWQILTARTADPRATKNDLILLFCYFLVLVVVSNAQWSSRWIQRLAIAVSTVGFMVALIGVVQLFSGEVKIYGFRRTGGSTFGPYVNHNHFAGFMEMVFPLTLGLLVSSGSTARRCRWTPPVSKPAPIGTTSCRRKTISGMSAARTLRPLAGRSSIGLACMKCRRDWASTNGVCPAIGRLRKTGPD